MTKYSRTSCLALHFDQRDKSEENSKFAFQDFKIIIFFFFFAKKNVGQNNIQEEYEYKLFE